MNRTATTFVFPDARCRLRAEPDPGAHPEAHRRRCLTGDAIQSWSAAAPLAAPFSRLMSRASRPAEAPEGRGRYYLDGRIPKLACGCRTGDQLASAEGCHAGRHDRLVGAGAGQADKRHAVG
jgi:hypothetical protein